MAKKKTDDAPSNSASAGSSSSNILRAPAEDLFASELDALVQADKYDRPPGWQMSPRAVLTYICGGTVGNKIISAKYIGHQRLVDVLGTGRPLDDQLHLLATSPDTQRDGE